MTPKWNPELYQQFENERKEPFFDLLQLIHPVENPRILDLGCGDGALTKELHEKYHAAYTLGIDYSPEMLEKAQPLQTVNLIFKNQDIQQFKSTELFNLLFSNAALQWVPNHQELFQNLAHLLAPGGQLAIQMPANQNYPTHTIAKELAQEEPFNQKLKELGATGHLLEMEDYAILLDRLGFESQMVRTQVYGHYLASTAVVLDWVKGSLLTYYEGLLGPDLFPQFFEEYKKRVIERLGWAEPFFFPMKRLLLWAQLPS